MRKYLYENACNIISVLFKASKTVLNREPRLAYIALEYEYLYLNVPNIYTNISLKAAPPINIFHSPQPLNLSTDAHVL